MLKKRPGFWLPPEGKPEVDVYLQGASTLDRIKRSISPAAIQIAASKAQAFGTEFGNSGVFADSINSRQHFNDANGMHEAQLMSPPTPAANFDAIQDDYNYRVASALYKSGCPDDTIEWEDGSVSELYSTDMAILHVRAGRQMDHVDIELFNSVRDLDERWNSL